MLSCLLLGGRASAPAAETPAAAIAAKNHEGKVEVTLGGEPFTTYDYSTHKKPILFPVFGPGGVKKARGLSNFTGAGKDDKLKFAFMIFDEDGNGVITKGELTRILKANHMASVDSEVARKADTIMAQADKDGDGVVTFDEFVIVSKKFPNILFPAYTSGS